MGLFGKKPKRQPASEPRLGSSPDTGEVRPGSDETLFCVSCGRELGFDPEDEPDGDGPGRHLCGECNRARNFDADFEMMWWNGDL